MSKSDKAAVMSILMLPVMLGVGLLSVGTALWFQTVWHVVVQSALFLVLTYNLMMPIFRLQDQAAIERKFEAINRQSGPDRLKYVWR